MRYVDKKAYKTDMHCKKRNIRKIFQYMLIYIYIKKKLKIKKFKLHSKQKYWGNFSTLRRTSFI